MAYTTEDFFREISPNEHVFLIGNGINHHNQSVRGWQDLLRIIIARSLGASHFLYNLVGQEGVSNTEIQNLLIMEGKQHYKDNQKEITLNRMICEEILSAEHSAISTPMLDFALNNDMPILTTNFDFNIENYLWGSGQYKRYQTSSSFPTHSPYRWKYYYSHAPNQVPLHACGVWHIHGSRDYVDSLIFSMTNYILITQRAIKAMDSQKDNHSPWEGENTWLDLMLHRPLIIAGLSLDKEETFLRWLLIERMNRQGRWLNARADIPKSFYLERKVKKEETKHGKEPFLRCLGIETIYLDDDEIYAHPSWLL